MWSVKCEVWSVKFEVWSAKSAVCSVRCGVSREGHGRDRLSLNYRSFIFGKLPPPACPGLCYPKMEKFFNVSNLPQLLAPFGGTSRFSMIRSGKWTNHDVARKICRIPQVFAMYKLCIHMRYGQNEPRLPSGKLT